MQNYNAKCRIRNTECKIILQNAEHLLQNAECKIILQNVEFVVSRLGTCVKM